MSSSAAVAAPYSNELPVLSRYWVGFSAIVWREIAKFLRQTERLISALVRPLLWLLQLKNGEVKGRETAVGIIPTREELNLEGVDISDADLEAILTIDVARWKQEMEHREEHLSAFERLPEEIWEAHRRVAAALDDEV